MGRGRGSVAEAESADRIIADEYREQYRDYYHSFATPDSPALRDPNPTVVLIPGLGMFSFGKSKTEARITGEFYTNAIHVMEGASLLSGGEISTGTLPQCGEGIDPASFKVFTNYVALPAFGGVSHRVLGDGRGQDSPPAAGERTEPAHRAGGWRRQRHWPRSGATGCGARRARDDCRSR